MSRSGVLARFLISDLFRSLAGIVPLAAAVVFGLIAFEYGMDQAQLITVGGIGTGTICFLTGLLLANRANRAASYPLLARLRHRGELLAAIVLSSLALTSVLTAMIVGANLLADRLTLSFPSALWILPTWAVLWLLAATLALLLSGLVGRGGSHLLGYALLVGILVLHDRHGDLQVQGLRRFFVERDMEFLATAATRALSWSVRVAEAAVWPVGTLLGQVSPSAGNPLQGAGSPGRLYPVALALTLACTALCFAFAVLLFDTKDLLWAE